jgi:hypothetical protein
VKFVVVVKQGRKHTKMDRERKSGESSVRTGHGLGPAIDVYLRVSAAIIFELDVGMISARSIFPPFRAKR